MFGPSSGWNPRVLGQVIGPSSQGVGHQHCWLQSLSQKLATWEFSKLDKSQDEGVERTSWGSADSVIIHLCVWWLSQSLLPLTSSRRWLSLILELTDKATTLVWFWTWCPFFLNPIIHIFYDLNEDSVYDSFSDSCFFKSRVRRLQCPPGLGQKKPRVSAVVEVSGERVLALYHQGLGHEDSQGWASWPRQTSGAV